MARWPGNAGVHAPTGRTGRHRCAMRSEIVDRQPRRSAGRLGGRPPAGTAARRAAGGFIAVRLHGARPAARSAASGFCHFHVRITRNAGLSAQEGPPRNWGSFPPPAFGGLCRPEAGAPSRPRVLHNRRYAVSRPCGPLRVLRKSLIYITVIGDPRHWTSPLGLHPEWPQSRVKRSNGRNIGNRSVEPV